MASSSAAVQAEAFPDGTTDYVPLRGKKADLRKPRRSPWEAPHNTSPLRDTDDQSLEKKKQTSPISQ